MRISDWSSDVCSSDLIEGREIGLRHIDFAPHLEDIRRALRQLLGNIPDRPGIGRDIFAHQPVAPCRRADQLAAFIADRERKTVDLVLSRLGNGRLIRSEEQTSALTSLLRTSYAVI